MEKRMILAHADYELTEKQRALFAKDIDYVEASFKAEEQALKDKDWSHVDRLLKEREAQPDAIKSLRTKRYKQLISAWEKETRREARQKQSESPSLERRNINSKENSMSDVNENDYEETKRFWEKENASQSRDPKEEAFLNTVHQRKVITDALKAGKLSCLPGTDGFADTEPAVNLVNGTFYHGANLLFLKEHQKENGFPSAEYITIGQIEKAHKDNPDLFIRKGQHGVSIYVSEKNEETNEWENKSFRLFNVAQTTKPAVVKEWAEQQRQEKLQEKLEYLQAQYGTGYKLPEPQQKGPDPVIECSSTEPEKYLGQYLAAVSMGGKFKASQEQAAEFSKNLESTLFERMDNGHTNPFKLENISNAASSYCKETIIQQRMLAGKLDQPQQQQEQAQSRGRGM